MRGLRTLLTAARDVSASEYALLVCCVLIAFIYRALHIHFIEDLLTGFRGHPVQLIYNSASSLASQVLPQCRILHGRYAPTPWLCASHLQTAFLHFFGRPPQFEYHRKLYRTPDGGTIALDWLFPKSDAKGGNAVTSSERESLKETNIAVIIPGLTSDSGNAYVRHIVYSLAISGWRVVVANHRGLGGVSITSNRFYNAGWTEDLRRIIIHLHQVNPKAHIFAVGTSIGANILVKYLGEEGDNTPLGGAAVICCPWDLLVCDRFISREWIQRFYDKILAFGLRSYAALHQVVLSQIADWDLISKSRTIRDFDNHCTCVVSQYETVDTYYRQSSSASYLHSVSVPLLCLSALDDPLCTKEAIPWDECRVNANVVLGITRHGGHLSFFEGLTAHTLWWVRATTEFLKKLSVSPVLHVPCQTALVSSGQSFSLENFTDRSPYLSILESGLVAAETVREEEADDHLQPPTEDGQMEFTKMYRDLPVGQSGEQNPYFPFQGEGTAEGISELGSADAARTYLQATSSACSEKSEDSHHSTLKISVQNYYQLLTLESALSQLLDQVQLCKQSQHKAGKGSDHPPPAAQYKSDTWTHSDTQEHAETHQDLNIRRRPSASFYKRSSSFGCVSRDSEVISLKESKMVARQSRRSLWFLAYIAIVTTWPLIGSALSIYGKGRLRNIFMKLASK